MSRSPAHSSSKLTFSHRPFSLLPFSLIRLPARPIQVHSRQTKQSHMQPIAARSSTVTVRRPIQHSERGALIHLPELQKHTANIPALFETYNVQGVNGNNRSMSLRDIHDAVRRADTDTDYTRRKIDLEKTLLRLLVAETVLYPDMLCSASESVLAIATCACKARLS